MAVRNFSLGFTLIELLVVIAVIGVLAGAIIAVINPPEQLARSRDAARKSAIEQLGKAVIGKTVFIGSYPPYSATWIDALKASGEIKAVPTEITPRPNNVMCWGAPLPQNNFCYYTDVFNGNGKIEFWVWTNVESKALLNKCGVTVSSDSLGPYYVYDSVNNKTCLKCASDQGTSSWVFSGACHAGE